jgi:OmpA-OmpF porin, OOP family
MILSLGVISLLFISCASVRENEALFQARAAYDKARTDPMVVANAPVALEEARQELQKAEESDSEDQMTHRSYMTIRKTELAVAVAQEKAARDERARLAKEKERVLLEGSRRQTEIARAQVQEMERELANLRAKKTERGYVVTLGDILFATNKAELMPASQGTLDQVAAFLNKHPEIKVIAQGHTDNVGSAEYNVMLSKARAQSVGSALMARGIARERITVEGRGELSPIASNNTAAGRQQNRRVELVFTPTAASAR